MGLLLLLGGLEGLESGLRSCCWGIWCVACDMVWHACTAVA